MDTTKGIIILIAEDDDGHAELIKEGLIDSGICNTIIRFSNGEEVWNYLSDSVKMEGRDKSYLLLLDVNMPKMNGEEVLMRMKSDINLKEIPIIMLTTTDDAREIETCYRLGCNLYITKPVDFMKFAQTLKILGLFIQVVKIA